MPVCISLCIVTLPFYSSKAGLFSTSLNLDQTCDSLRPTKCGRSETVELPEPGLQGILKILSLPPWTDVLTSPFKKASLAYWSMRGHMKENEDSPAIVNTYHFTYEWGRFELSSSDDPSAWTSTWNQQRNILTNLQNYIGGKKSLLFKPLGLRWLVAQK